MHVKIFATQYTQKGGHVDALWGKQQKRFRDFHYELNMQTICFANSCDGLYTHILPETVLSAVHDSNIRQYILRTTSASG